MFAVCMAALVVLPRPAGAEQDLTWQEANRRSASLIHEKGHSEEAAGFARAAFELYAVQSQNYSARGHGQLLLNWVDARLQTSGTRAALKELDRGVEAIAKRAGSDDQVLIDVWREAVRISMEEGDMDGAGRYYEKASTLADKVWGENDGRAIGLHLRWAQDLGWRRGYRWALHKYKDARKRAAKAGEDSALVLGIDLALAKLELEQGSLSGAIGRYQTLIEQLEARKDDSGQRLLLQIAYAQLEYAYGESGDKKAASEMRERLVRSFGQESPKLEPLARVRPIYPRSAANRKIEGSVLLKLTIGPDGAVQDASVLNSNPSGTFDEAALEAVRQWKFRPRIVNGQPVKQEGIQRIDFKL